MENESAQTARCSFQRVSRALETLRDCHRSLVRAESESALMRQICRTIVETGGYRFAWVGLTEQSEHSEQRFVHPAAQWGVENGYLEKLDSMWPDAERTCGPTAMALRSGTPTVIQNIMEHPGCTCWREEALRRNFASTVSLPLLDEKRSFGTVGIYAEEPDAFDTEELGLLKELAEDLSYGLRALRLKARREREEKERNLLATACEQLEEGIAIFDDQGVVQYINLSLERLSGCEREWASGKNIADLGRDGPKGRLFEAMAQAMARGGSWNGRLRASEGGTERILEIDARVSPMRNDAGDTTNYIFVCRDVSSEDRLEKQLRQAQKMEALGTLAGGIAHDFNNILGAIISCAEFAMEDAPEASEAREDLARVLKAGDRGKQLIKRILTFSRHSEQERRPVQIQPLVKDFLKFLRASLSANIEIKQNISAGSDMILADSTQIIQVVMNLCTNAAHAMRENGGILEVSLSRVRVEPARTAHCIQPLSPGSCSLLEEVAQDLSARPPRGVDTPYRVRLAVSDTGHGMDQNTIERIFDPFFTTKKRGEGSGLGLSVAHGIVMSHGGDITVTSEPGKGTTFEVFLPGVKPSKDYGEAPKGPVACGGSERILFVDDEEDLVYAGEKMLKRLGYQCEAFQDSLEALKAFGARAEQFDLIITDQSMPRMTGMEFAREALRIRPGIPIVLCTGFSADSAEGVATRDAELAGIREVWMKPLRSAEMAGAIRKIFDQRCFEASN
ncbi:MAG: ATP-binding protein [Syntrophobacteraceae bacterium]|nr:ATP-binding protein [Syntrophobacteraceae bacterium]